MDGTQTLSWDHPMSLGSVPSWNSLGRNNLTLGTWTSNSASSLLGAPLPELPRRGRVVLEGVTVPQIPHSWWLQEAMGFLQLQARLPWPWLTGGPAPAILLAVLKTDGRHGASACFPEKCRSL